jgi:hypothetical protein
MSQRGVPAYPVELLQAKARPARLPPPWPPLPSVAPRSPPLQPARRMQAAAARAP